MVGQGAILCPLLDDSPGILPPLGHSSCATAFARGVFANFSEPSSNQMEMGLLPKLKTTREDYLAIDPNGAAEQITDVRDKVYA